MRRPLFSAGLAATVLVTSCSAAQKGAANMAGAMSAFGLSKLYRDASAAAASRLSLPTWANTGRLLGRAPSEQTINFRVYLSLQNRSAALAELDDVSNPASGLYGEYLSADAFRAKYSPADADVENVRSWLEASGLSVTYIPKNQLYLAVTGSIGQIETALNTQIGLYDVRGQILRSPMTLPQIPDHIAALIDALPGLDQSGALMHPHNVQLGGVRPGLAKHVSVSKESNGKNGNTYVPPPPASVDAPPCSAYWAQAYDKTDPAIGAPYPKALPYAPCGFTPTVLRSAYNVTANIQSGNDGTGVTVAIVDAFAASPTLFADAHEYSLRHDPAHPLLASQFTALQAPGPKASNPAVSDIQGWYGEETLDVEALHAMAPGANIVYVGASSDDDLPLVDALNYIVDENLATIVSNSYGDVESTATEMPAYENVAIQAGLRGIGLYFASGDNGDEALDTGANPSGEVSPDFPASLPMVTAVGATSVAVNSSGSVLFQTGWETGVTVLTEASGGTPASWSPVSYQYGSGGGTSRVYAQPAYQAGIVPKALATLYGKAARVVPDLAMNGDPFTGFIIGETQTFPSGSVAYGEYAIGGTSLATPLMAGMMALAQQHAAKPIGFANPRFYALGAGTITDILPNPPTAAAVVLYNDGVDATQGETIIAGTLGYAGPGNSLTTAKGYDNVTGLGSPTGAAFVNAMK